MMYWTIIYIYRSFHHWKQLPSWFRKFDPSLLTGGIYRYPDLPNSHLVMIFFSVLNSHPVLQSHVTWVAQLVVNNSSTKVSRSAKLKSSSAQYYTSTKNSMNVWADMQVNTQIDDKPVNGGSSRARDPTRLEPQVRFFLFSLSFVFF